MGICIPHMGHNFYASSHDERPNGYVLDSSKPYIQFFRLPQGQALSHLLSWVFQLVLRELVLIPAYCSYVNNTLNGTSNLTFHCPS